jgi:prepilin-type N-terminal cleavage/methylation domain-containing protein
VQQRLQQRIHAARKVDGGFTLIELLIVIVILGVLAGVVVFSVQAISNRGANAACETDKKSVASAAAAYYADHANTWPAAADTPFDATVWGRLVPGYLQQQPAAADGAFTINATGTVSAANCP